MASPLGGEELGVWSLCRVMKQMRSTPITNGTSAVFETGQRSRGPAGLRHGDSFLGARELEIQEKDLTKFSTGQLLTLRESESLSRLDVLPVPGPSSPHGFLGG